MQDLMNFFQFYKGLTFPRSIYSLNYKPGERRTLFCLTLHYEDDMRKTILISLLAASLMLLIETRHESKTLVAEPKADTQQVIPVPVTVTAYSARKVECDGDPFITAYQNPVREGTIAISRDLESEFGWREGDRVHLAGLGVFEVNDRMASRWKKRVDIFFHDTKKALSFGIKQSKAVKVDIPDREKV